MIPGAGDGWDSIGIAVFMSATFRNAPSKIRRYVLGGSCVGGARLSVRPRLDVPAAVCAKVNFGGPKELSLRLERRAPLGLWRFLRAFRHAVEEHVTPLKRPSARRHP